MYVLDTHVLLWWTLDPGKLSRRAAAACHAIEKEGGGVVSSISLWELGVKIKNRKIDIGMTIDAFAGRILEMGTVDIVAVDLVTWLANLDLDWSVRDPVDRTIVALAAERDLALVTKDAAMRAFYAKAIW